MDNFFPLSRDIQDHWIYQDSQYYHVWSDMLFKSRYAIDSKTDMYEGIIYTISRGQFIFGYPSWSRRLKIGEQKLRTLIKKLLKFEMITLIKMYPKFTIYEVVNYKKYNNLNNNQTDQLYQGLEVDANNVDNKQITITQQSSNNHPTTKEESKKEKKEKKVIDICGINPQTHKFIPPTIEEVKQYCQEKQNKVDAEKWWYFYDSKNWMVGKTKMSKWKSAINTWEQNNKGGVNNGTHREDNKPMSDNAKRFYAREL